MKKEIILLVVFIQAVFAVISEKQKRPNVGLAVLDRRYEERIVTLDDRTNCSVGDTQPPNRHNTTDRVNQLLTGMSGRGYTAYVVPSTDEHQDEYVADSDKRREYISGFTGSAGTAVVLINGTRALWTDGRYFLQADEELDCEWILMKDGQDGVPTISEWLLASLTAGDVVAADARLIGADTWIAFRNALEVNGITVVVDTITNGNSLLDEQWNNDGRPALVRNEIFVHDLQYAGTSWQQKIADVASSMAGYSADAFVVTALDEIAWLLNLRGSDIPYNPVFQSYVIIDTAARSSGNVYFFIDGNLTTGASNQLGIGNCVFQDPCVSLFSNNDIGTSLSDLDNRADIGTIMIPDAFSTTEGASYYIYELISAVKRVRHPSPILLTKAMKNSVEQDGMRNAHIKDAAALISFLAFLDQQIAAGEQWTEFQAQEMLAEYRFIQDENMGLSFESISAFGSNAAIIHYTATSETDTQITDQNVYMLDSGGQYKDGTTDVTRTMHYGTPTAQHIEAYTRVLMGVIDFVNVIVPRGTGIYYKDILARRPLYDVGLDYRHGTSHGVGMFLFVHEATDVVFQPGFCMSDEPGFYEDGQFGIRIENVIMSVNTTTKYNFTEESLAFETITLVPFEPKLIDLTMLSSDQCAYLDDYNAKIRSVMGPVLAVQNLDGYNYMMAKTNYSCTAA